MPEDVQPNERLLNQRAGAVPVIRPARGSWGGFQRGRGNSVQSERRIPGERPNHPNFYYNHTYNSSANTEIESLPNRPNNYRPNTNGSWTKRRRIDYSHPTTNHDPIAIPSGPKATIPARPPKPRRRRQPEVTELLVDLPPECRKGAPESKESRHQWKEREILRIYAEIGIRVEFRGVVGNTARFVCADDQTPPSTRDHQGSSSEY